MIVLYINSFTITEYTKELIYKKLGLDESVKFRQLYKEQSRSRIHQARELSVFSYGLCPTYFLQVNSFYLIMGKLIWRAKGKQNSVYEHGFCCF